MDEIFYFLKYRLEIEGGTHSIRLEMISSHMSRSNIESMRPDAKSGLEGIDRFAATGSTCGIRDRSLEF